MDEATTTKPATMRELLARWAEVESGRCEKLQIDGFTIWTEAGAAKQVYNPDEFCQVDLAWIQWAVQAAIVERGWAFELSYYSVLGSYDTEIDIDSHRSICREGDNPAEALLATYLRALEYTK